LAVKDYGVELAVDMIQELWQEGIRGFHFCTLNLEKSVQRILENLDWISPTERKSVRYPPVHISLEIRALTQRSLLSASELSMEVLRTENLKILVYLHYEAVVPVAMESRGV
jgi:hypothetical protein